MATHFISVRESDFLKNAAYLKIDVKLIKGIVRFLEGIEYHTMEPAPVNMKLYTILYRFLKEFPVAPTISNSVLVHMDRFIKKGNYGNIYYTEFDGIDLVTKLVREFEHSVIRELFINFVIINSILLSGKATRHLVPTYGIFICQHAFSKTSKRVKRLTGICKADKNETLDGKPNLHMVQELIHGNTLDVLLETISCLEFHRIICSTLKIMILLEESPYRLYHSDLHCKNIMIKGNGDVYIIDFGFSSFTYDGVRYRSNFLERDYSETPIYSAAYDITFLLIHSYQYAKHDGIKRYIRVLLRSLIFSKFWRDIDTPLTENYQRTWLYDILSEKERALPQDRQKIVHEHNMNEFSKLTYRSVFDTIYGSF